MKQNMIHCFGREKNRRRGETGKRTVHTGWNVSDFYGSSMFIVQCSFCSCNRWPPFFSFSHRIIYLNLHIYWPLCPYTMSNKRKNRIWQSFSHSSKPLPSHAKSTHKFSTLKLQYSLFMSESNKNAWNKCAGGGGVDFLMMKWKWSLPFVHILKKMSTTDIWLWSPDLQLPFFERMCCFEYFCNIYDTTGGAVEIQRHCKCRQDVKKQRTHVNGQQHRNTESSG